MNDEEYMGLALAEARKAYELGEVPIGAVVVKDGEVIATAYNLRETGHDATAHAEVLAIRRACEKIGHWRLTGATLYVTIEPCPMCAGALVNSRIDRVVYGAKDMIAGCCGSVINFNSYPFNHSFSIEGGVCEDECRALLQEFFNKKRSEQI